MKSKNTEEDNHCPWCGSAEYHKNGKRKTHQGVKQIYFCRACKAKFTDGDLIAPPQQAPHEPMPRFTYPQNWEAYNQAQTEEGRMLRQILFELSIVAEQKRNPTGRPRLELRDLSYGACLKAYTGFSSRRLISELQYAHMQDYITHVPHFNTILNAFNSEELTPVLEEMVKKSCLPCKMLEDTYAADSTGFTTNMYSRWLEKKYGKFRGEKKEHTWVKAHAMVGVKTHAITSVEVTPGTAADSPQFIPLLEKTKPNARILEVCADKAYSSRPNLDAVAKIGALPNIPFRKNTTGNAEGSRVWKTMYNYFILHREEFDDHYHQRSNVESVFSMMKRKFGHNLRSKSFLAMKNEILAKAVVHNICCLISCTFEFGISPELIWGKPATITINAPKISNP